MKHRTMYTDARVRERIKRVSRPLSNFRLYHNRKGKGWRITEDVYIIISVDGAPAGRARRHFWLQDAVSRDGKKPIASRGSRAKDKRNIITTAVRIHYA